MGVILFIVSFMAGLLTFPIGIGWNFFTALFSWDWKRFNGDMLDLAISIDQTLNVALKNVLRTLLITDPLYNFGDPDQTVSYVIGINYVYGNLTSFGHLCRKMLYSFDKDHVIKAVMKEHDLSYEEVIDLYNENN